MSKGNLILVDIEKNPLAWVLQCSKCGSMVNVKYASAFAPMLGVATILPYFYCPCNRFQLMELRPAKLISFQAIIVFYSLIATLLTRVTNYVLRRNGK